ncbi:NADH-quinone oxidoreductase subunit C [Candidatus Sumerlaeota bacterium]|nr:NADH-quinone oxidoreductase subunit C [Candidatus Sumerlaeota bacterium]
MNKEFKQELESIFRDITVNITDDVTPVIAAAKPQILAILRFLKDKGYGHLAMISCVDWLKEAQFELVYLVSAYLKGDNEEPGQEKITILLKTRIDRDNAELPTAIPVFENAEPYEREIHELFGIHFTGHPRLLPLFLEREYKIPPFRKDFDSREYVKEVFDKIPFVEDKE